MIELSQYEKLIKFSESKQLSQEVLGLRCGMHRHTVRKYLTTGKGPQMMRPPYRTRKDPLVSVWEAVEELLHRDEKGDLQATSVLGYLKGQYPDVVSDPQLRTLQRRIRTWRVLNKEKEVFFELQYRPGEQIQGDFTAVLTSAHGKKTFVSY